MSIESVDDTEIQDIENFFMEKVTKQILRNIETVPGYAEHLLFGTPFDKERLYRRQPNAENKK